MQAGHFRGDLRERLTTELTGHAQRVPVERLVRPTPTSAANNGEEMPEKLIDQLVNRFLAWPLPDSVAADLCATMQGHPHRSGTTLLSAIEAKQMLLHVAGDLIAKAENESA